MNFICLGSGSSGNCYYLYEKGVGILIDLGIGVRLFKKYFELYGLACEQIKAILVTHDHADHVKSVGTLKGSKRNPLHIPVYATSLVHMGIERNPGVKKKVQREDVRLLEHGQTVEIGPFKITSFKVPHDSMDNSGYYIECGDTNLCLMTDVGHVTDEMKTFIAKSENLIVEANYDAKMLREGRYPEHLKQRIVCGTGHLCNNQTAEVLAECLTERIKHVWLCHLSGDNNTPVLARKTVYDKLSESGWSVDTKNILYVPTEEEVGTDIYQSLKVEPNYDKSVQLQVLMRQKPSLLCVL